LRHVTVSNSKDVSQLVAY